MSEGYASLGDIDVSGSVPVAASSGHGGLQFQDPMHKYSDDTREKLIQSHQPRDDTNGTRAEIGSADEQVQRYGGWFDVVSYRPYFNVDTLDVLERIHDSLLPHKGDFIHKINFNPDMYGPFWITTTLIFLTSAFGNLASYLTTRRSSKGGEPWHYDIDKITLSASLFYGYIGLVPLALYFLLKNMGVTSGLLQLWCLYGYSLFIFIPASVLSIVPVEFLKWVIVAVAAGMSATFLALNIRSHIGTTSGNWLLVVGGSFALQLGLALMMKLYFFTF